MLRMRCPACGIDADETELAPGGEAHLTRRGPEASDAAFEDYLFMRKNPKGVHFERWFHANGCRKWFHMARHTVSHEILAIYGITEPAPKLDGGEGTS